MARLTGFLRVLKASLMLEELMAESSRSIYRASERASDGLT